MDQAALKNSTNYLRDTLRTSVVRYDVHLQFRVTDDITFRLTGTVREYVRGKDDGLSE